MGSDCCCRSCHFSSCNPDTGFRFVLADPEMKGSISMGVEGKYSAARGPRRRGRFAFQCLPIYAGNGIASNPKTACKLATFHTSATFFDSSETRGNIWRDTSINTASSPAGIQIHMSSLCSTAVPRPLKNRVSDIGETKMGCQGKK